MNRLVLAMAGVVLASTAGAQVPGAVGRSMQVSVGAGTASAVVATGEPAATGRGGTVQSATGTAMIGAGFGERFVVGFDVFWARPAKPGGTYYASGYSDNMIAAFGVLAKFYPARRGFFAELGSSVGFVDVDMARLNGVSSANQWTATGAALRYGLGYDLAFAGGWSLTPYVTGMFMPQPFDHATTCHCAVSAGSTGGPPVAAAFDAPMVNVLHAGLAITYTRR